MELVSAGGGAIRPSSSETLSRWIPAPSIVPGPSNSSKTSSRTPALPRCPEIDCIRHLLPIGTLARAELRAAEIGSGADRVLIAEGTIDEETYVRALCHELKIQFEPLDSRSRGSCPLTDEQLIQVLRTGMLPIRENNELFIVVAPRELAVRRFIEGCRSNSDLQSRIRFTTGTRLSQFTARHAYRAIGFAAAESFRTKRPEFSAGAAQHQPKMCAIGAALFAAFALLAPGSIAIAVEAALGVIFLAWTFLRFLGTLSLRSVKRMPQPVADWKLPVYTIVIALYREAAAVGQLVGALRAINYPPEKLDIKLVLEPDDHETLAALRATNLEASFEIVIAPDVGPKTKPKALNAAVPFARGDFIAVYDAEDRPEPDQLRLALEAFVAGDHRLACVQARLTIDNTSDSLLTRLFTAEYAGLFDVFLPGLAAWRLPLPLGGSSNHFRTQVLRNVGAWDPYNVTEDADLGMRLARLGYRTAIIQSTTYEEAPARLRPWLKQRTRWCKGWMQTWVVHMRSPGKLRRELGWTGFSVFQLLVGGTVLAALVHSLFVAELLLEFATGLISADPSVSTVAMHAIPLVAGYLVSILLGALGLFRRGLLSCAWILVLVPVYWILLSIAAWRALYQLVRDPYRWEKTEHGLARTSRLAQRIPASRRSL